MPMYLGNTKIGQLYFGSTKIGEAYLGSTKIYSSTPPGPYVPALPYLVFQFSNPTYEPNSTLRQTGTWTKTSNAVANEWYWECNYVVSAGTGDILSGWAFAFARPEATPVGVLTPANLGSNNTCSIVGYGNLTGHSTYDLKTMDRMFANCTSLVSIVTIQTPNTLLNVGGCFSGCTEMAGGTLGQYNYWSTYNTGISNHSGTFTDAGANTASGLLELDQIPTGWGGNLMPASHTYTAVRMSAAAWLMDIYDGDDAIPFDNLGGALNIFTTSSVSAYAGVNMRKTNIWNRQNGFSTSAATYYYPMFWQGPGYPTKSSSSIIPHWIRTTSMYNGMLSARASAGDMPGTLDYATYGPMDKEFGTFDSTRDVYFGFLVLNAPIDSSFDWSTTPFGIHSNNYFKNSVINWFIE